MKISSVKIKGFRSIKNDLVINFSQITALIGANNSGKSNILSALYSVLGKDWITVNTFDEQDVYNSDHDTDIEIEVTFDEPFEYYAFVGVDPILIPKLRFEYTRYKIGDNKDKRRLEKKCLSLDDKEFTILAKKPKKGEAHQYQRLTTIPQVIQESIPVIYINSERVLKNQLPNSRNSLLGALLKDINEDFLSPNNKIKVKDRQGKEVEISRKDRFNQCISAAITALRTEEFINLEASIQDNALNQLGFDPVADKNKFNIFFNPLTSLEFYKSLEIFVNEYGFVINATELGGGFQNAIVIAILKAFEERKKQGAIFLIEEPEMYLHPQMQRSLYKTIREIGQTNQVIYITHSPHFVTIPYFNEIVIVKKDSEGTSTIQSELKIEGRLREKFIKELDPERNEFFFSKKVLIVEGDTEKLALPEYCKRQSLDLDKLGISIVEVGGKRNLKDFVDIAISFKMPVAFIYDIDSSDFQNKEEERNYNKMLDSYKPKGVTVWALNKNYESELRNFFSEPTYQQYCQKYSGYTKAIKARLIAIDNETNIPDFISPIIQWLKE